MPESVSILLAVGCVAVIVAGVLFLLSKRTPRNILNKDKYRSKWLSIETSITRETSATWTVAILNADKLLDEVLEQRNFKGSTMGERMKSAREVFSDNNAIWAAHKIRNRLAHEPDSSVTYDNTRKTLASFKRALKDTGAI